MDWVITFRLLWLLEHLQCLKSGNKWQFCEITVSLVSPEAPFSCHSCICGYVSGVVFFFQAGHKFYCNKSIFSKVLLPLEFALRVAVKVGWDLLVPVLFDDDHNFCQFLDHHYFVFLSIVCAFVGALVVFDTGCFFYWSRPKSSKYGTGPTQ